MALCQNRPAVEFPRGGVSLGGVPLGVPLKGLYKGPYSTPPAAKVETKNHHKTMIFEVPEAEILRTPIKIEKLSLWNRTWNEFIMNFEFHRFLEGFFSFFFNILSLFLFFTNFDSNS